MKLISLVSILILLFLTAPLAAQPDSLWSRTYGGRNMDICYDAVKTNDGRLVLAGSTFSYGCGNSDYWLLCLNEAGDRIWDFTYGGREYDECFSLVNTNDGGFALAGRTSSFGAGGHDFWLVRTISNGDSLWARAYGTPSGEQLSCIVQTSDGGFALVGYTDSLGGGDGDFWMIRTNSRGDSLWSRTYDRENQDWCYAVIQTNDGGFALAGYSSFLNFGSFAFLIIKTDSLGNLIWSRKYDGISRDVCKSLIQTKDNGYLLAGNTYSLDNNSYDIWIVRISENGDSLWSRTLGGAESEQCETIIQTGDGGIVIGGFTRSFGAGGADYWIIRLNENGDSLWSRTFGGGEADICYNIIPTADRGFALAGYTKSFGAGYHDFWLVKTGPDPVSVPSSDFIPHPTSLILLEPYPNPFNGMAIANCKLQIAGWVGLSLYNSQGRLLRVLDKGWLAAGEHRLGVNAAGLPAGMYWLRLTDNNEGVSTQPMVLVK